MGVVSELEDARQFEGRWENRDILDMQRLCWVDLNGVESELGVLLEPEKEV